VSFAVPLAGQVVDSCRSITETAGTVFWCAPHLRSIKDPMAQTELPVALTEGKHPLDPQRTSSVRRQPSATLRVR
jgi:hypothetical protein